MAMKGVTFGVTIRLVVPSDNEYDTESYADAMASLIRHDAVVGSKFGQFDGLQDVEVTPL